MLTPSDPKAGVLSRDIDLNGKTLRSGTGDAILPKLAGLGKAILPELLVKDAIDDGRLEVLDGPHTGTRAYWLVAPTPQWRTKKVKSLVSFLSEQLGPSIKD